MFTTPLCLEVIAGDEMEDALYEMGIAPAETDLYKEPTFPVCFYRIDAMMIDNRSTAKKPLTIIVCGELTYLVKFSLEYMIELVQLHR